MHHLYVDTRLSRIKIAVLKMFIDETLFGECLQSFGHQPLQHIVLSETQPTRNWGFSLSLSISLEQCLGSEVKMSKIRN